MSRQIAQRHDVILTLGEIFRARGFSGTTLAEITAHTGLGKGSLYHFFPNGKKEMAETVLDGVTNWFKTNVFLLLHESKDPDLGIKKMFEAVDKYFYSGERICLVGAFALDDTRDQFKIKISAYFSAWAEALTLALKRNGCDTKQAKDAAEDILISIQGALVLARSQNDSEIFTRTLERLQKRLADDLMSKE